MANDAPCVFRGHALDVEPEDWTSVKRFAEALFGMTWETVPESVAAKWALHRAVALVKELRGEAAALR
jgi:hypothetical protein